MPPCVFPDLSLALTSALGNVFLPYVLQESGSPTDSSPISLDTNGRLCLFYSGLLNTNPRMILELERNHEENVMIPLMHFLFLHSSFAKDKLAVSSVNNLWDDNAGVGELEFMEFQADCVDILESVCSADK